MLSSDAKSEVVEMMNANEDDGCQSARRSSDENDGDQPARRRRFDQRADSSSSDGETAAPEVGGTAKHPLVID